MSLWGVNGVFLKLSRLFLKICRWVLGKMSLNCKLSSFNGRLPTNSKMKRAKESLNESNFVLRMRKKLVCLWIFSTVIGFIWVFSGVNDAALKRKEQTTELCEEKAQIFLEHLNVSQNQLHALASLFSESDKVASMECTKVLGSKMQSYNGIACVLKIPCSEKQKFEKHHRWVSESAKSTGQCSVQDDYNPESLDALSLEDDTESFVSSQSKVPSILNNHQNSEKRTRTTGNSEKEHDHCQSYDFCFVKVIWWVLIGIIVTYRIPRFHVKLWGKQKQKLIQNQQKQQPVTRQQQQLLQLKHQQESQSHKGTGIWRKRLLIIFVIGGVSFSVWLFWNLNEDIVWRRKDTLGNMCDERARMLQDQFNVSLNHVHALALLVSTFHHGKQPSAIDQKTFEEYTEDTAFERPLTSGVAYALRVTHSEREQFEKQQGWTIKKMETEDQTLVQDCTPENLDPSPIHDEYAPVIFSQETVSHIVSIDMMSGKEDRENILRARASGKGVLTSPFKLLKSNHLGVVLTFAVYKTKLPPDATPEQRIEATVGYLGASYDVPSLVEKLLHQLASKQTIVVNVYDTTNSSAPINMYGESVTDTGLLHISSLDFGDPARKHEMQCRFKQKPSPPWTAIMASAAVIIITLLLGQIFYAAIKRIAEVEADYSEMTELKTRAEAADVAKSQFLATVSHEIRTPMNGVLGMLQMLMDTELDPKQQDYAQTAHASGKDLISLINEVLDQAKIESGKLELEDVPFDLRAVLDNVLSLFSGKSYERGIELAVYVSDQVPEVVIGDPGRFRQIITNLVGNSIKFTKDEGHVFVSVHLADQVTDHVDISDKVLRHCHKHGPNKLYNTLSGFPVVDRWKSWESFKKLNDSDEMIRLLVTVEDTGVGIPLDAQSRIFTPFMQADSSTSRLYGGTGIGLSISKRLVDLMGGEIGFVSEPGIGSTFSFTAAFGRGETGFSDTKWQNHEAAVSEFQGLRALVVDGRSIRAEVTRYHLRRLGVSVDIVSGLESACSYLTSTCSTSESATPVSMILVDKDVWDKEANPTFHNSLKESRRNGILNFRDYPPKILLVSTAMSSTERNELKAAAYVDNVLTKPLRLSVLIACFQEALGLSKKRLLSRGKPPTLGTLLKGKRILVVDDNKVNRRVAEGALKKYGAIVTCVESGKVALAMLNPPHDFDACFMDLQMPEMDGFEATRKIRAMEKKVNEKIQSGKASFDMFEKVAHWHTPILAMTADLIQATNEACMKCGMDDYVSKPFEEEQLYSAVARFFELG